MEKIDELLNKVTMYRLVVYALSFYVLLGTIFAFMGRLAFTPTHMMWSLLVLLTSAYLTDKLFSWFLGIPNNRESWLITALILFLIVQPADTPAKGLTLVLAGVVSSTSKYILAVRGKHIFNPAALAAAGMSYWGVVPTTWWVGNSLFWPFTLLVGLAVVRKVRRFPLFISFLGASIVVQYLVFAQVHQATFTNFKQALLASPLIFLATIMLTEPATMPPRRNLQIIFAVLVGVLYAGGWQIGPLDIYPEVALLTGNVFAYAVSPKFRVRLELQTVEKISERVYNYVFRPDRRFSFLPGQYMEWTLPGVPYDSRGNRRTFTIASSPTESNVQLGVKYYEPASMYKAALHGLRAGDVVYASQLAGNFTLNGNERKKLAFIAGGIGITPFRSMVKYLTDTKSQTDIILLYIVSDPAEFTYVQELQAAHDIGIRTVPIVTNLSYRAPDVVTAKLNDEVLAQLVPDYAERIFYISGPNVMVDAAKNYLRLLGVTGPRIKTDHFSGY